MMWPAHTQVSLFASAMSLPASMAAIVGRMPIMPTIPVTTISADGIEHISINPSIPETTRTSVSASLTFSSSAAASS